MYWILLDATLSNYYGIWYNHADIACFGNILPNCWQLVWLVTFLLWPRSWHCRPYFALKTLFHRDALILLYSEDSMNIFENSSIIFQQISPWLVGLLRKEKKLFNNKYLRHLLIHSTVSIITIRIQCWLSAKCHSMPWFLPSIPTLSQQQIIVYPILKKRFVLRDL